MCDAQPTVIRGLKDANDVDSIGRLEIETRGHALPPQMYKPDVVNFGMSTRLVEICARNVSMHVEQSQEADREDRASTSVHGGEDGV